MRYSTMTARTSNAPAQPTVILLHGLLRKAKCMEKLRKCVRIRPCLNPSPFKRHPRRWPYDIHLRAQLYCIRDPRGTWQRSVANEQP